MALVEREMAASAHGALVESSGRRRGGGALRTGSGAIATRRGPAR
jgi:hypothetical protein